MIKHSINHVKGIDRLIHDIHPEAKVAECDIIGMDLQVYKRCADPKPGQHELFNSAIIGKNKNIVA